MMEAGTKVRVDNKSSFFHGKVGKVSKKQPARTGIYIDIAATDGGTPRKLWFTKSELKPVSDD